MTVSAGQALQADAAAADGSIAALVSEGFAQARGLRPGARVNVLLNGRQRTLRVVGIALSPQYIFAGLWGMPDMRGYGIFWIDQEALEAAYDLRGAFNRIAVKLVPGADERGVADALARQLSPWGGRDVHGRDEQASHQMLDNEIKQQRVLGSVLPAIFFGVAAFLLNVVVARLVATQREQVATLKALGYANLADRRALPEAGAHDRGRGADARPRRRRPARHAAHRACMPSSSTSPPSRTASNRGCW